MWVIGLVVLSAIANAAQDKISHHFYNSVFKNLNPYYWNPEFSWRNKYKNRDPNQGKRFVGSTTFLVWVTDAWHLLKFLWKNLLLLAVVLDFPNGESWEMIVVYYAIIAIIWGMTFEIFYELVFNSEE